jgi:predicted nucleic acid-binding Zn ribbon protein
MKRPFQFMPPLGPPPPTTRQRVLAQWRGLDLTGAEKTREQHAQPVHAVMPQVLKHLRMDRRRAEAEIVRVWNHLLDPLITAHAQPTGLANRTLFVSVDSNVWLDEILRYRRKEILDRLRHSFGEGMIKKLSFRVG